MMVRRVVGFGLGLMLLAGGTTELRAQDEAFEWRGQVSKGQTVEVRGISGNITAELASGSTVEIVATKHGRRGDFDEVTVELYEGRDGITVCAVYGRWNRGDEACDGGDDGEHRRGERRRSINVSVDFEVRVPAGVEFVGSMVSGDVEARDLESEVTATTVSGDVVVSTTEVAWGTTVSGSIDIEMGSSDWDDLHFSTVSGDITLLLPEDLDADIDFESLSGDFHADFDVDLESRKNRWVGSHVRGTIGDGGRRLSFSTVSGDVRLRRTRAGSQVR